MKYVDMNDVAFDAAAIAFPGLGNCHGIVYQTNSGLFAYHAGGNPLDSVGKAEAFGSFVANHMIGRNAVGVCLYGACPTNRHGTAASQKVELQSVARALKFNGTIRGHRWDLAALGWNTTYVEFTLAGGAVTVTIEDYTGQASTTGVNADAFGHKFVKQGKDIHTMAAGQFAWAQCTTKSDVVIAVARKPVVPTVVVPAVL